MSWSWSHTQEAYDHARSELEKLGRNTQLEILAEWKAYRPWPNEFDESVYNRELALLTFSENIDLAEAIWEKASEHARCNRGGYGAWMCPFGCGPHTVSFGGDDD